MQVQKHLDSCSLSAECRHLTRVCLSGIEAHHLLELPCESFKESGKVLVRSPNSLVHKGLDGRGLQNRS